MGGISEEMCSYSYDMCLQLMDHLRALEYISYSVSRCSNDLFKTAANKHKDIMPIESVLDSFAQVHKQTYHLLLLYFECITIELFFSNYLLCLF